MSKNSLSVEQPIAGDELRAMRDYLGMAIRNTRCTTRASLVGGSRDYGSDGSPLMRIKATSDV